VVATESHHFFDLFVFGSGTGKLWLMMARMKQNSFTVAMTVGKYGLGKT
jgi:hypothetical protein